MPLRTYSPSDTARYIEQYVNRRRISSAPPPPANQDVLTLIAALGGDSQVLAFYDVRFGVTTGGGGTTVASWADARAAIGPTLVASATQPAWDSTNKLITGNGTSSNLSVSNAVFDLSANDVSMATVSTLPGTGTGNDYVISISKAGFANGLAVRNLATATVAVGAGGSATGTLIQGNSTTNRTVVIVTASGTVVTGQAPNRSILTVSRTAPTTGAYDLTLFDFFPGGGSNSSAAMRVTIVGKHAWSSGEVTAIQNWAQTNHAAVAQS